MEKTSWFRNVFITYEGSLLRYTAKFLGNEQGSQEIVQECFLKLLKERQEDMEGKIPPWLYLVCRNAAIDVLRKSSKQNYQDADEFSVASNQEDAFIKKEIITFMMKLSPKQQEALVLKFQEGMSYKEIAIVMKTSESHVGVLIHEGIKFLREMMGGQND